MRLIDADYILSALNVFSDREYGNEHFLSGIETAREIVKDAPTIEPKPQWIPVTEKLPENEGDFIVTANDSITGLFVVKDHCYKRTDGKMQFLNQIDGNLYHNHDGELKRHTRNITAWMPLPEPYTLADVKGDDNAQRVKPVEFDQFKNDTLKDVQPVVHGKWKPVRYTTYCSCGKSYETYHYLCTACNHIAYAQPYGLKYCPNCGAKMDKEVNDDD